MPGPRSALMKHAVPWTILLWAGTSSVLVLAADATPPTTPTVTDDGAYSALSAQLHASWISADPESGVAQYQYLIRQDATTGAIIVTWTSTGLAASVTRTGLSLLHGKLYYVGVRAKNGAGLWSSVGYSNGITIDTTPPTAPGPPKEGSSTTDYDYDGDGAYTVHWPAASDPDSGIAAYEVQERLGPSGTWTTLTSSRTSPNVSVSGRLDRTTYFYKVRARNGAGLWGGWSAGSDGMLIDRTAPTPVTVTDDGPTTPSLTQLHARWTSSNDAESGVVGYEYLIRQDSTSGTIMVNHTSVGTATEMTRTGLSLLTGATYYIGVRAKNGAWRYSATRYSDGIVVQAGDTVPPVLNSISPPPSPGLYAGDGITVSASVTDIDPSPLEYQFSVDGVIKQAWSATTTYQWATTSAMAGSHTIAVEVRDAGGATSKTQTLYLYLKPPGPP